MHSFILFILSFFQLHLEMTHCERFIYLNFLSSFLMETLIQPLVVQDAVPDNTKSS